MLRNFHKFSFLFLAGLLACAPRPVSNRQQEVFGVSSEIVIVGKDRAGREKILDEAFRMLRGLEEKWDASRPGSEIFRINKSGFAEPQEVSPETFEIIRRSIEFFEKSGGAFDLTVRPLRKLWGFDTKEYRLPSPAEIQALLPRVGSNQIRLDLKKKKVGFRVSGMEMDLNGLVKGYACDRTVQFLKERGVGSALVNIGDTIAAFGQSSPGKPWRIGLRHPRDPTRTLKVITLANEAVSTVGDDEQFFVVNSHRYAHFLNPRTGYPANQTVTVSVVAPSALAAQGLSSTLFVLGPEKAAAFAHHFPQARWHLTYFIEGERFRTLSSESS